MVFNASPIFLEFKRWIFVWKLSLMNWRTDRRQETGWKLSGDMWKVSNHEIVTMAVSGGGRYSRYNYRNKVWIFPLIFDTEPVSNEQWMWCCDTRAVNEPSRISQCLPGDNFFTWISQFPAFWNMMKHHVEVNDYPSHVPCYAIHNFRLYNEPYEPGKELFN